MRIFERSAGIDAVKYAEAQALIDDGFSLAEVLTMFREDKEWLAPLLTTTAGIRTTYVAEEPSYYFEASLKNRFLEASRRRAEPSTTLQRFRTTAAGAAVLVATGAVAVVTLGFVTANNAVPGDWNYSFKLAHERMEYALASGNDRVDVELHQAEARVYEIQQRSAQGQVSANDINKLQRETATLKDEINRNPDLDDVQRTRLRVLAETVPVVLNNVTNRNAELAPAAEEALNVVNGAVAAGFGGTSPVIVTAIATPSPTAATALTSTTTATPVVFTTAVTPTEGTTGTVVATEPTTPTPSGTVEPTKTPEPTVSTTPEPSETPTETVTPTPTPAPSTTVTPSTTPEPSRTTEPQVGGTPTPPASTTPPVSSTPTPPTEH